MALIVVTIQHVLAERILIQYPVTVVVGHEAMDEQEQMALEMFIRQVEHTFNALLERIVPKHPFGVAEGPT